MKLHCALALLLLADCGSAAAHSRGTSYSEWTVSGPDAQVTARVSELELTRLALDPEQTSGYAVQVAALLREDLQLWSASGRCAAGSFTATPGEDGWVVAQGSFHCADTRDLTIRSTLLQSVAPSHLHFARVQIADQPPRERVLTYAEPGFVLGGAPDLSHSFVRYLKLGVEHILSGWDHMAFVLALILLAGSLKEVALLATGFTAAHSLTLAAAVLGWATVRPEAIEALIGFSIALVAAENLWLRAGRERWIPALLAAALVTLAALGVTRLPLAVLAGLALFTACYFALAHQAARPLRLRIAGAFLFGLVHGFGFAGAMTQANLPKDRLAAGLLGFNSGVELGQVAVIAAVWPLLKLLERRPGARVLAGDAASACICALGTFWFVTRTF